MSASYLEIAETVLRAVVLAGQTAQAIDTAIAAVDQAREAFATDDLAVLQAMLDRTHAETLRIGQLFDAALVARQAQS
ncbi:hypothetical protein [Sphingomonas sp. SRS2]|uniref:hypothetical protein n=1 Tax=Sphingomonas sp. SRS2 TaxID=133190 RepID=UPI00061843F5|nr:hypothetical protein [Sphingomonas sp. SRS2]KKC27432.1 hypothetical protein WP12_03390 [Sphingomonas sp. SRS2]